MFLLGTHSRESDLLHCWKTFLMCMIKEHGEQSDLTEKRPLLASPRGEKQNKFISERAVIFHPCCLKPQR